MIKFKLFKNINVISLCNLQNITSLTKEKINNTVIPLMLEYEQLTNRTTIQNIYFAYDESTIVGYKHFYYNPADKSSCMFSTYIDTSYRRKGFARYMIWDTISFLIKKGIKHIGVPLTKSGGKFLLLELYRKFEKMYPGLISNSEDDFNRKYIK